jgi:deoxyadenosine/deoxycytidine kinase
MHWGHTNADSAGKSSLAKDLAAKMGFEVFLEPVLTNPLYA